MIKLITLITKFIVVIITAVLLASCNHLIDHNSITGSGTVTSEKRSTAGGFSSIEVSNAIDLVIEQSATTEIIVKADDNLQKGITTKIENGVLIIESKYNSFVNVASKKVVVKLPVLEELQASSASSVSTNNTIKGNSISIDASSAATLNLSLESETILCQSSSASKITLQGKAINFQTDASSGSAIYADKMLANEIKSSASSGSTTTVNPIVSLIAEASSGGAIKYTKTPKKISKNANSGGSIYSQ